MAPNHYKTLRVDLDATQAELRSAYLKLARAYHPDQVGADGKAEAKMQSINEAWNVLGVPHKRREYDAMLPVGDSGAAHSRPGSMRGNAHFRPFADDSYDDPIDRSDVDLDPTPIAGSRPLSRWISMMPLALLAFGVSFFTVGMLISVGAIMAMALVMVALGAVGLIMMPLIVMSRAERDPLL